MGFGFRVLGFRVDSFGVFRVWGLASSDFEDRPRGSTVSVLPLLVFAEARRDCLGIPVVVEGLGV